MKKIAIFLLLSVSVAFAKENNFAKDKFCYFSYTIYKDCYMRGAKTPIDCNTLSSGIRFGKAFSKEQIDYIKNTCKTGCYLAKNRFKLQDEKSFMTECSAK